MARYDTVDAYIADATSWRTELEALRKVLTSCALEETIKWGGPCYTHNGVNVVSFGAFKSYVALWFFQGALLADAENRLVNAQSGRTKAMRQWRFASASEIEPRLVRAYVNEAIELARAGRKVAPARNRPLELPSELRTALDENAKAGKAFAAMSPGKQREYAEHISEAKREETKARRLEKILPMIEAGVGLNDRYR